MKSKLICLLAALSVMGAARAQWVVSDPASLAQGIVNSSNEMVQTTSTAKTMLESFKETQKIYNQGKEYYDKLRAVNNLVRNARKVQQCILLVGDMSDAYMTHYPRMLEDRNFSQRELSVAAKGYTQLLQEGTYVLKDLQNVVNPTDFSMTDKERLDLVDKSYKELTRLKRLTDYFTRNMQGVAQLRARDARERERLSALYGGGEQQ